MPHVAGFEHDVFVAFAEADNAVLPGGTVGWIEEFVDGLTKQLRKKGISGPTVHAFLPGNLTASAARLEFLRSSATIVVVLSPAYLESDWCTQAPLREAMRVLGEARRDSVFVAEKDEVARERAAGYDPFRTIKFWNAERGISRTLGVPGLQRTSRTDDYYDAAAELVDAVASRLKALRPAPAVPLPQASTRIYLAEVTGDVEDDRRRVQRDLEQAGYEVVPRGRLPLDLHRFEDAVSQLLEGCRAFIQLLGGGPHGDRQAAGRVYRQLELAQHRPEQQLQILQWRSPTLNVMGVADPELKQLLTRPTVSAETIPEFCAEVKTKLPHSKPPVQEPPSVAPPRSSAPELPTVFVDVQREQVEEVKRIFNRERYPTIQWDWHEPPLSMLDAIVRTAEGVVLYWGHGDSNRTQSRYFKFKGLFKKRKKGLDKLLIYDGPPKDKPEFNGAGYHIAEGRDGNEPPLFLRFVQEIKNAAG